MKGGDPGLEPIPAPQDFHKANLQETFAKRRKEEAGA
jgi:hypothetical protein